MAEKELVQPEGWSSERYGQGVERVARAVQTMRELRHEHLIQAIAYYVQDGRHAILFPFAEYGNLREYWSTADPGFTVSPHQLKWTLIQLEGLVDGIRALHARGFCHKGLKPENILCFWRDTDAATPFYTKHLVIADMGLAKSHDEMTALREGRTTAMAASVIYLPPEHEFNSDALPLRPFDIWSLGCIFFECVVWLVYGAEGLKEFQNDLGGVGQLGTFYEVKPQAKRTSNPEDVYQVHSAVYRWVKPIKNRPCCAKDTALRRLVDLVVDRMLVVAPPVYGSTAVGELERIEYSGRKVNPRGNTREICRALAGIVHGIESGNLVVRPNSEGQGPIPPSQPSIPELRPRAGGSTSRKEHLVRILSLPLSAALDVLTEP